MTSRLVPPHRVQNNLSTMDEVAIDRSLQILRIAKLLMNLVQINLLRSLLHTSVISNHNRMFVFGKIAAAQRT